MTIGEKIKTKRKELGYSQKELAELTGMTNASILNVEKGQPCNMQSLERICEVLKLRIELIDVIDKKEQVVLDMDELDYDVRMCCKQLDKVKITLQNLVK